MHDSILRCSASSASAYGRGWKTNSSSSTQPCLGGPFYVINYKYVIKASQSTVQRRVLSTKGQSCLSAAELVMGHPRNPTAYYLASTLLAYRRLRPKSVHTCSCRCEHKGFAVSTQLLRLHLPVKCEQRILNQRSP